MYLEFPTGRLKLFGTLLFPRNKYLVLRPAASALLCEDVFESIVVFGEAWWVGTAEENPEEKQLPLPEALAAAVAPSGAAGEGSEAADGAAVARFDYSYGAGAAAGAACCVCFDVLKLCRRIFASLTRSTMLHDCSWTMRSACYQPAFCALLPAGAAEEGAGGSGRASGTAPRAGARRRASLSTDDSAGTGTSDADGDDFDEVPASQRARRASVAKRKSYAEAEADSDGGSDSGDDGGDSGSDGALPASQREAPASQRARRASAPKRSYKALDGDSGDEDGGDDATDSGTPMLRTALNSCASASNAVGIGVICLASLDHHTSGSLQVPTAKCACVLPKLAKARQT